MGRLPINVSDSVRKLNPHLYHGPAPHRRSPNPKPEQAVCHEPLGPAPREESYPSRCLVRIVSYRCRLLDPDNLAGGTKYFIDALRKYWVILDDSPQDIILQTEQVKVGTRAEERTEIFVS